MGERRVELGGGPGGSPLYSIEFAGSANDSRSIEVGSASILQITGGNPRTIAMWLYPYDTSTRTHNIRYGSHTNHKDFGWGWGGSGNQMQIMLHGDDPDTGLVGKENVWALYTLTYDGSTIRSYMDDKAGNAVQRSLNTANESVHLGRSPGWGGYQFTGRMGPVAIWNTALSAEQVKAMHKEGPTSDWRKNYSDKLRGYWTMGNISTHGTDDSGLAYDQSGNGRTGALHGGLPAPKVAPGDEKL